MTYSSPRDMYLHAVSYLPTIRHCTSLSYEERLKIRVY